jgi:hypothetical protein
MTVFWDVAQWEPEISQLLPRYFTFCELHFLFIWTIKTMGMFRKLLPLSALVLLMRAYPFLCMWHCVICVSSSLCPNKFSIRNSDFYELRCETSVIGGQFAAKYFTLVPSATQIECPLRFWSEWGNTSAIQYEFKKLIYSKLRII